MCSVANVGRLEEGAYASGLILRWLSLTFNSQLTIALLPYALCPLSIISNIYHFTRTFGKCGSIPYVQWLRMCSAHSVA